jgi:hypothetical protein
MAKKNPAAITTGLPFHALFSYRKFLLRAAALLILLTAAARTRIIAPDLLTPHHLLYLSHIAAAGHSGLL